MLASEQLSASARWPRVVLAHGFTQNGRCWSDFGQRLAQRYETVAIDAPGHGQSGHDDADLDAAGRLLIGAGGPGHYIGYSMGGRMLLHAALDDPMGLIRSLILIGSTPGIADETQRHARGQADADLADRIEQLGTVAFIDEWLTNPLFADLSDAASGRPYRYENAADGMAASLRNCGTGVQRSLWDDLSRINVPVLVIAGRRDDKFTTIGQTMVDRIGDNARFVAIEGGHAVHLENPLATGTIVASWVDQLSQRR